MAVPARDGISLAGDLYLPPGGARRPALVVRTPYGRRYGEAEIFAHPSWYARQGFAVLVQDCRGRGDSEGEFHPFAAEADDGAATVEWAAAQDWCDGNVGSYGFSYPGSIQLLAAARAPQGLRALAPTMAGSDFCEGWTYRGGALQLAFVLSWVLFLARDSARRARDEEALEIIGALEASPDELLGRLPVRRALPREVQRHAPYLAEWLDHPIRDGYWSRWSPRESYDGVLQPALHVAGWYDIFLEGTIENFAALRARGVPGQQLEIGPWQHYPWARFAGEVDSGPEAWSEIDERQAEFFASAFADDGGTSDDRPVRVFVMGSNSWREEDDWPPRGAREVEFHLRSSGRANSLGGDGRLTPEPPPDDEPPDVYASDPVRPVASVGGRSCCDDRIAPMGPADPTRQELRADVLVYESDPLERPLLMVGSPRVLLFAATDAPSVDYVVRLAAAGADGTALAVSDGNVRLAAGRPATGSVDELEIMLAPTAIRIDAGRRIRLDVASSNFPALDRNPQTSVAAVDATWLDLAIATQTVFHDAGRPSRIVLPVVPD